MNSRIPTTAAALLLLASMSVPPNADAQNPVSAHFERICRVPLLVQDEHVLDLTGIGGRASETPDELAELFPGELQGKPRYMVALGLRDPGLVISFPEPVLAYMVVDHPPQGLVVSPPELLTETVELSTVVITWDPQPGRLSPTQTYFGPDCFFEIRLEHAATALGSSVLNLIALYGEPGDTISLWGTAIGLPDIILEESRQAFVVPVHPASWGKIKSLFE